MKEIIRILLDNPRETIQDLIAAIVLFAGIFGWGILLYLIH